jgi:hypothetical protein
MALLPTKVYTIIPTEILPFIAATFCCVPDVRFAVGVAANDKPTDTCLLKRPSVRK